MYICYIRLSHKRWLKWEFVTGASAMRLRRYAQAHTLKFTHISI